MTTATQAGLRFSWEQACAAGDAWGFNCGPAAICAVLNMTPDELRPHMLDFEAKRYTNPSLMVSVLRELGVRFRQVYRGDVPNGDYYVWPREGLVRVQWGGPWTKPGVPMKARYRKTHWIGVRHSADMCEVFDINAMHSEPSGWILFETWEISLVPWILKHLVPKADGAYWPTHCLEIVQ